MSTKFWEVVGDEQSIGGSGEYCGNKKRCAPRPHQRVLQKALVGNYDAENLVNLRAGKNCSKDHYKKAERRFF